VLGVGVGVKVRGQKWKAQQNVVRVQQEVVRARRGKQVGQCSKKATGRSAARMTGNAQLPTAGSSHASTTSPVGNCLTQSHQSHWCVTHIWWVGVAPSLQPDKTYPSPHMWHTHAQAGRREN
jgi:hypothetical protein